MKKMLVLATLAATVATMAVTATSASAAPSKKKFCDVNWKVSALFNTLPDEPTAAQSQKIQTKLDALLDQAVAVAPPDIEPDVTAATALLKQGFATAFENPALGENGEAIDAWAADNCGYQVVEVHATEYHFAGIPKKLDPGRTIFKLTNDGKEVHEIAVARIKTKTPIKKLLADEKRANKETAPIGGTFAPQGATAYAYVDLKNGRHAAVCFVPSGSTDPNTPGDGPPHAAQGMYQEFTVSS